MTFFEVAKEVFPNLDREQLDAIIWSETGFPAFFAEREGETIENCFRRQLQEAKSRMETPGYYLGKWLDDAWDEHKLDKESGV
jgi:hypothetical protein